jgi:hypothetical protein
MTFISTSTRNTQQRAFILRRIAQAPTRSPTSQKGMSPGNTREYSAQSFLRSFSKQKYGTDLKERKKDTTKYLPLNAWVHTWMTNSDMRAKQGPRRKGELQTVSRYCKHTHKQYTSPGLVTAIKSGVYMTFSVSEIFKFPYTYNHLLV